MSLKTTPCRGCESPTLMHNTGLCDGCYEVHSRCGMTPLEIQNMKVEVHQLRMAIEYYCKAVELYRAHVCPVPPGEEKLRAEVERLTKDVAALETENGQLRAELRCPDCGCATPDDADAAECGCDGPRCAIPAGMTLAVAYAEARAEVERLTKERGADLAHTQSLWAACSPYLDAETIGKTWSEIIHMLAEREKKARAEVERLRTLLKRARGVVIGFASGYLVNESKLLVDIDAALKGAADGQ